MIKPYDPTGNRTRDLSACSTLPHPTAPLRTPTARVVKRYSTYVRQEWKWEHSGQHVQYINCLRTSRSLLVDPDESAAYGVVLRPLACWNCGFESGQGHGCLSVVSVVCCQVEVSGRSWSLVHGSPECVCPWVCLEICYLHAVTVKNSSP